jgi:hypothetical protein
MGAIGFTLTLIRQTIRYADTSDGYVLGGYRMRIPRSWVDAAKGVYNGSYFIHFLG